MKKRLYKKHKKMTNKEASNERKAEKMMRVAWERTDWKHL